MLNQKTFAKDFKKEMEVQSARLAEMFNSLVETLPNGEIVPKPSTKITQLRAIKDGLTQVLAIYQEASQSQQALNEEFNAANIEVNKTRQELIDFEKEYKIELPTIIKSLYRI
jgi:dihydroxyacetone kinase-like predicted kinase